RRLAEGSAGATRLGRREGEVSLGLVGVDLARVLQPEQGRACVVQPASGYPGIRCRPRKEAEDDDNEKSQQKYDATPAPPEARCDDACRMRRPLWARTPSQAPTRQTSSPWPAVTSRLPLPSCRSCTVQVRAILADTLREYKSYERIACAPSGLTSYSDISGIC